jgi:hypothetical protein
MVLNLMNNENLNEIIAVPPQRGGWRKATRGVLLDKMTKAMGENDTYLCCRGDPMAA